MNYKIDPLNLAFSVERKYWSGNIFGEWVKKKLLTLDRIFKSIIKRQGEFISELGYEKVKFKLPS